VATPGQTSALRAEAHRINFNWLVKLRWVAVTGQVLTTWGARNLLDLPLPVAPLMMLIGATTISNLVFALWSRAGGKGIGEWTVASVMALDVGLLTALLYLSGGPYNPFSSLYFVHIALGAVTLSSAWTWSLVGLTLVCFGSLFVAPGPAGHPEVISTLHGAIEGTWLASALAASVIAYFVRRVQTALGEREEELALVNEQRARSEKLASLATLSAGAAHELSTPLSTIAVVAKELERSLAKGGVEGSLVEDTRLIREQVDRCRMILEQMAAEAGHSIGELAEPTPVGALIELCLSMIHGREQIELIAPAEVLAQELKIPKKVLAQALRGLIKNALDASPAGAKVALQVSRGAGRVTMEIRDRGRGIPPEILARIGEPFFTTKEPGRGIGLGVFLARAVLERVGGELRHDSSPEGTVVSLWIPC
jgi:two-component system sensor histidine kinase RegB